MPNPIDGYFGESETDPQPHPSGWKAPPPWMDLAEYRKGEKKARWRLVPFAQPTKDDSIEEIKVKLGHLGREPSGEEKKWMQDEIKKNRKKWDKIERDRDEANVEHDEQRMRIDNLMEAAKELMKREELIRKREAEAERRRNKKKMVPELTEWGTGKRQLTLPHPYKADPSTPKYELPEDFWKNRPRRKQPE